MRLALGVCLVLVCTAGASAQSAYVGASFIGDIIRVSGSTYGDGGNGETFGGALRVGTPLGERWGVELEFARSGKTDMSSPQVLPASARFTWSSSTSGASFPIGDTTSLIFPPPQFSAERRLSTLSTMLWWSQDVGDRLSLVYLGGIAFTRNESRVRFSYPFPLGMPSPIDPIFPIRAIDQKTTSYDADVAVGFEGRVGMTEHLRLVPGIRLQTAVEGWAIRPGVGLQWVF